MTPKLTPALLAGATLITSVLFTACGTATEPAPAKANVFTYKNPISSGIEPLGVRDCQVFRDGNKWYMTATAFPHWERQEAFGRLNPGVVLYSSDNLTDWKFEKVLVRPNPDKWYFKRFWAPEVQKINGKYYATFNCTNVEKGFVGQHFGYAVSDTLMGEYKVVTVEKPLANGNDFTLFQDDDGKVWAFWNRGKEFGIGFAQIDLDKGVFLTEPVSAIQPSKLDYEYDAAGKPVMAPGYDGRPVQKIKKCYDWDSIGIEGAYIIKRNGIYYLFYSSWTRGYEIGYATASSITGPWTKAAGNPIYGEQSEATCKKVDIEYTGNPASLFNQVGHNEVFTGPDGRIWISCHGIMKDAPETPLLVIDPLDFDAQGNILKKDPTFTPQEIILPAKTP